MFLLNKTTQTLVEVLSTQQLFDPFATEVNCRVHAGEELQDPEVCPKAELIFTSGESLPRCWIDPHYRDVQPPVVAA
jgi:hypothetical protein